MPVDEDLAVWMCVCASVPSSITWCVSVWVCVCASVCVFVCDSSVYVRLYNNSFFYLMLFSLQFIVLIFWRHLLSKAVFETKKKEKIASQMAQCCRRTTRNPYTLTKQIFFYIECSVWKRVECIQSAKTINYGREEKKTNLQTASSSCPSQFFIFLFHYIYVSSQASFLYENT